MLFRSYNYFSTILRIRFQRLYASSTGNRNERQSKLVTQGSLLRRRVRVQGVALRQALCVRVKVEGRRKLIHAGGPQVPERAPIGETVRGCGDRKKDEGERRGRDTGKGNGVGRYRRGDSGGGGRGGGVEPL